MLNWVFGDIDCIDVVKVQCYARCCNISCDIIVLNHVFHPDELLATAPNNNILCFYCGEGYIILLFAKPRDQVVAKEETSTRCTFSIIRVASPICVTTALKKIFRVMGIPQSELCCSTYILNNFLDNNQGTFLGINLILSTNSHTITYI